MKVNLDVRDLAQGRYIILILSTQITCKTVKYANSYTQALELANKYEQVGCICIISRILNNSLSPTNKLDYND